jgi:hypothetical protein
MKHLQVQNGVDTNCTKLSRMQNGKNFKEQSLKDY